MKEQLLKQLIDMGRVPKETKAEDVTEEFLLKKALEVNNEDSSRLNMDEFKDFIAQQLDAKRQEWGIDKIHKDLKLPGWEDSLNDADKELLKDVSKLSAEQKRYIANKQLISLVRPVAQKKQPSMELALNTEGTTTTGGFLVPVEFIAQVSTLLENYGVMRRNANIFNMSSMTATKPKLNAKPTGAYVAETAAKPESNPTFTQLLFTRHDYAFITGVSRQLLEDSGVDLIGLLAELAAYDFAKNEDNQTFNGTTLTDYLAESGNGIVPVTTSGAAITTVGNPELLGMIFGTAFGESDNTKFYFHRTWLSQFLQIKDTQNRPIYSLTDQLNIMNQRRIMGYPFELVEVMQPATGNNYLGNADAPVAGDIIAYFGDMKRAATLALRKAMDIQVSDVATVGSNSAFEKNLFFWRFEMAHDFVVENGAALTKLVLGT